LPPRDFSVTSVYTEAGERLAMGKTWVTPFVGLDITDVKMMSFSETGVGGANLAFASQSQDQTSFLAGMNWAGRMGILVPEARIAYRHDEKGVPASA
jgi:trimeric autotransporter adhesin